MNQKRALNQTTMIIVSTAPLFYGASDIGQAAFLSAAVLLAVLIFEIIFYVTKRFWLHSLRPLFALIVLASVLSGIFLICEPFLINGKEASSHFFPLTLVSAFLLVQSTITMNQLFKSRIKNWIGFSALLLIIGVSRHWNGTFQMFPSAAFWVSGGALGIFFFLKREAKL